MGLISGGMVIPGARYRAGGLPAEALGGGALIWVRGKYLFSADGGAISAINLLPSAMIPNGAIIWQAFLDVITVPTSGGAAQVSLGVESATDLQAAVVISGAPYSTTGRKSLTPAGTGATSLKLTADRNIVATISVATLTAGEFDVWLAYLDTLNA